MLPSVRVVACNDSLVRPTHASGYGREWIATRDAMKCTSSDAIPLKVSCVWFFSLYEYFAYRVK